MVAFILFLAIVNIPLGYALAVALRPKSAGTRETSSPLACNAAAGKSRISAACDVPTAGETAKAAANDLPGVQSTAPSTDEKDAVPNTVLPPRKTAAAPERVEILAPEALKQIAGRLDSLRSFADKGVARSLCQEFRGLAKTQLDAWSMEFESQGASDALLHRMAQAESTISNLSNLDWARNCEEIIDDIQRDIRAFKPCLSE